MTTIASIRHSERGICAKCGHALFIPEWSEYVSERLVLNLWSCTKCGYRFETLASGEHRSGPIPSFGLGVAPFRLPSRLR
jgi:ribosomal protein L37AE/L43A